MQYSTNNNLKLPEGTDNVKRQDFVDNFTSIDDGLSKFYVATLNSTNVYKITTGLNKTSLANGYSIRVAIPSASTGAASLIVDGVAAKAIKNTNGVAVSNLKQNGVYSLTYYNSVFILTSGSCDTVSFSASDLLVNKSANNSDGIKVAGTMDNRGAVNATLGINGTYTIPQGYHNGQGKVTQSVTAKGSGTDVVSLGTNNNNIYARIPQGAYFINASTGYPEIIIPYSSIAPALGITSDKIVSGNSLAGVAGSATIASLGGKNFSYYKLTKSAGTDLVINTDFTIDIVSGFFQPSGSYSTGTISYLSANITGDSEQSGVEFGGQFGYLAVSGKKLTISSTKAMSEVLLAICGH